MIWPFLIESMLEYWHFQSNFQAKDLTEKLQSHTDLFIGEFVILSVRWSFEVPLILSSCTFCCFFLHAGLDADMLLKKDLVTLDEAVKTANSAVLMSITAVSVLTTVSFLLSYLCLSKLRVPWLWLGYCCVHIGYTQKTYWCIPLWCERDQSLGSD